MHVLAYRSLMSINAIEGHHRNVYGRGITWSWYGDVDRLRLHSLGFVRI
jgi:hypothetical protein